MDVMERIMCIGSFHNICRHNSIIFVESKMSYFFSLITFGNDPTASMV